MQRVLCLLLSLFAASPALAASTLYVNGKVFTGDPARPYAESILVRDGMIRGVGSTHDLQMLVDSSVPRRDLQGRTVVAAIKDAHAHVAPLGHPAWWANDPSFAPGPGPSAAQVVALAAAKAAQSPAGTPVIVFVSTGFYETAGADPRALLDTATTDHPVVCVDWSGHGNTLNSAALALAGYADHMPNPYGGRLSRDDTGRLTGYVQELAEVAVFQALSALIPPEFFVDMYRQYDAAAEAYGYEKTFDIHFVIGDALARSTHVAASTHHTFDIVCMIDTEGKLCQPGRDGVIRRKVFLDGGPVDCSTWVGIPYRRPETCPAATANWQGLQDLTDAQLDGVLDDVLARGGILLVHALGDAAVEQLLQRLEARPGVDWSDKVTLEHGDMVTPEQVERIGQLNLIVVQNLTHIPALAPLFDLRFVPEAYVDAQPLRSLLNAGARIALGSDTFMAPTSPWVDISIAVNHPRPSERLTVEEAITAYTRTAAVARHDTGGFLQAGQPASFLVLNQDVFTVDPADIALTMPVLTVINGADAYSAGVIE